MRKFVRPHSSLSEAPSARIDGRHGWFRLVLGLFLVFGLFHGSATILGSDRGQKGILVGTLVVVATLPPIGFCCVGGSGRPFNNLA